MLRCWGTNAVTFTFTFTLRLRLRYVTFTLTLRLRLRLRLRYVYVYVYVTFTFALRYVYVYVTFTLLPARQCFRAATSFLKTNARQGSPQPYDWFNAFANQATTKKRRRNSCFT